MARRSPRAVPTLDALESRQLLTTGLWPGTFVSGTGMVTTPRASAEVSLSIPASQFQNLPTTYFEVAVSPTGSSALSPQIVSVHGAHGELLPLHRGKPFVPGLSGATVFFSDSEPGPVTIDVKGRGGTTGSFQAGLTLPGDVDLSGQVNLADEKLFTEANHTVRGDAKYNPLADANQNDKVGQSDGRLLLRNFAGLTPPIPLRIKLTLPSSEQAHVPAKNSGGISYRQDVTVIGSTTPGSLIFADGGLGDYRFNGPAFYANAQGRFEIPVTAKNGINNLNLLIIDPFGNHLIKAFPIMWLGFNSRSPLARTQAPD